MPWEDLLLTSHSGDLHGFWRSSETHGCNQSNYTPSNSFLTSLDKVARFVTFSFW